MRISDLIIDPAYELSCLDLCAQLDTCPDPDVSIDSSPVPTGYVDAGQLTTPVCNPIDPAVVHRVDWSAFGHEDIQSITGTGLVVAQDDIMTGYVCLAVNSPAVKCSVIPAACDAARKWRDHITNPLISAKAL